MEQLVFIILIGLLGVVVFQDFKSKEISWFLIPLLFMGFATYALFRIDIQELITFFGLNFLIIAINLIGVTLLISIKEKRFTNILKSHLGLGDVLFFLVLTLAFSPLNFIIFYLGSVLFITLLYAGFIYSNKKKALLIPLAGAMSVLLIFTLTLAQISSSFQLYQDIFIIE